MSAKKITLNSVKALKSGQTIWDSELKGFGCRCQKETKTFILKYREGKGRTARQWLYTIGKLGSPWTPESAREETKKQLGLIANGKNPAKDRKNEKEAKNIDDAFDSFIKTSHGKRGERTIKEYKRMYKSYVQPKIGKFRVQDVAKQDIQRIVDDLSSTPVQVNRLLQMLKAFFNWKEIIPNPCTGINKYKETKRDMILSEADLYNLGIALDKYQQSNRLLKTTKKDKTERDEIENPVTPYVVAAIRLLIFTGARRSEILTLKWEDVDFKNRLIRLKKSKTGQKTIYLSAPALQILSEIPRIEKNPYVICGKKEGTHLVNIKDPWLEIRKNAGLTHVRLHDLRHNYASTAVTAGHHLKIIGTLLGHADTKTTERYAHLANDPIQTANESVSSRILKAMTTKPTKDNVIKIHG